MSNPVAAEAVSSYLNLGTRDAEVIESVVEAVNAMLITWKGDLEDWPAHFVVGGVMLAARIYRRRNSPSGVESFGEMGPVYVSRNDPDIAQLLELGAYKRPQVG